LPKDTLDGLVNDGVVQRFFIVLEHHANGIAFLSSRQFIAFVNIEKEGVF
jgi:hypothetical protein